MRISPNAFWLGIPIVALLWFPSPWLWLGFLGALGWFLLRWLGRGAPFPITRLNSSLLIFLALVAVSFAVTPTPALAIATVSQLMAGLVVFFVCVDYSRTGKPVWHLAGGLVLLGVVFALAAPFLVHWSTGKLFGLPEIYTRLWPQFPDQANPNILAGALAPILPIALAMMAQSETRSRSLGAIGIMPILLVVILLQSRGAFLGLAAGIVVWLALYNRWWLPLALTGILGLAAFNVFFGGASLATLLYGGAGAEISGTLVRRQDLWLEALFWLRQSPLLGIGLGAYPSISPGKIPHVHNLFLQVALDTGVIGLAAYLGIGWVAMRAAWSSYRAKVNRHLAIGVLAAFVVLLVHGLGDVIVWGTAKSSIVLWMLLALAIGLDEK